MYVAFRHWLCMDMLVDEEEEWTTCVSVQVCSCVVFVKPLASMHSIECGLTSYVCWFSLARREIPRTKDRASRPIQTNAFMMILNCRVSVRPFNVTAGITVLTFVYVPNIKNKSNVHLNLIKFSGESPELCCAIVLTSACNIQDNKLNR